MILALTTAHRIGLPPFLAWMTDRSFLATLLICWAITPGMMIVVGLIGESRLLPLGPTRQFLSFFPGDLFLGAGVAAALQAARELPDKRGWWTAPVVGILIVILGAVAAYWLTLQVELKGGVYPKGAILSPTKIYHNVVLYIGYGYLATMVLIADVAGLGVREIIAGGWLSLAFGCIGAWALLVVGEGMIFGKEGMAKKARHAHVEDWVFLPLVVYFMIVGLDHDA